MLGRVSIAVYSLTVKLDPEKVILWLDMVKIRVLSQSLAMKFSRELVKIQT
jgi:hypothetical protein